MLRTIQEKPARLQVDPDTISDDDKPPQTGTVFNIWFLQWSGGDSSKSYSKLKFRVNIKEDSGYTKASYKSPICLFFARGCCYLGKKCSYLHRLPSDKDYYPPTQDCFGRDKTADYKDDMSGVGSFNRSNRTLYIGGIHMSKNIENILTKHFQEFGSIDKIRVLYSKGCAFVTFRLETEAQFAKEAMLNQSLDDNEVLSVRWASEDPNPEAQKQEKRRLEELAINTVKNLLDKSEKRRKTNSSSNTISDVTVEEVESKDEEEIELSPKKIQDSSSQSSFFHPIAMRSLEQLRELPKLKTQNLSTILGYESSDEE